LGVEVLPGELAAGQAQLLQQVLLLAVEGGGTKGLHGEDPMERGEDGSQGGRLRLD
jgi:hypothetical protein